MARDKRTARAEARRRHREQIRAQEIAAGQSEPAEGDAQPQDQSAAPRRPGTSLSSLLRLPDIREDARALPGVARHTWALALPLALVAVTFVIALVPSVYNLESAAGDPPTLIVARAMFQFILLPPPVTPVFLAGVLAPRASWLVGGIVGLASTAAFAALVTIHEPAKMSPALAVDLLGLYLPLYILLGGFAGWYRKYLLGRQQRSRQAATEKRKAQAREGRRAKAAAARR